MKIAVIGSGSWGTALAQVLSDNHHECLIYGRQKEQVDDINRHHQNSEYFGGVNLNAKLKAVNELSQVKDADILVLAIPSTAIKTMCLKLNRIITKPVLVVNVAKGFDPKTHERLSEVITKAFSKNKLNGVVSLLGPSHAEEVVVRKLTTIDAVSTNKKAAKIVQKLFSNDYFRVYYLTDMIGAEIATGVKNIMALASGIAYGLGLGDNARAGLMTRGLAEMTRYGEALGGKPLTFLGLCGVGDLIVTCTSEHSRNFTAGKMIGQCDSAKTFWETNKHTVEGVKASEIVYEEAKKRGIEMPITEVIYKILYQDAKPSECITGLMQRSLKAE